MVAVEGSPSKPWFVGELRRALQHIYDPAELGKSALILLLGLEGAANPALALQQKLLQAIESLKPGATVPPQAPAWRVYHILNQRYAGQFAQRDIATNLALSMRQLRRLHLPALQALADLLWARHGLAHKALSQPDGAPPMPAGLDVLTREQELEWLKRSLPSEAVDVAALIQAVLAVARPLIEALRVHVACAVPDGLPRLAAQPTTVRHALLNILSVAVCYAQDGTIEIRAEARPGQVCVHLHPTSREKAAPPPLAGKHVENLNMARQLAGLCGGSLELAPGQAGREAFVARLLLPAVEQVTVLAIDDNADALRLLEHYLTGTRYHFVGVRDPREAVLAAEEAAPQIIVLDLMLPGVDGWELLGRLREHPRTRQVPVVVCSILPQEDLALALGAAALIRKPVSRAAFLSALDRQLGLPSPESR
jgi:CheY-like chemotaxis protein